MCVYFTVEQCHTVFSELRVSDRPSGFERRDVILHQIATWIRITEHVHITPGMKPGLLHPSNDNEDGDDNL